MPSPSSSISAVPASLHLPWLAAAVAVALPLAAGSNDVEPKPKPADRWAFHPPSDPAPPPVRDEAWPRNAIDRFVLAGLEAEGLRPAARADRRTWLRRVTYDLVGLPPSEEELAAFLADGSPDAEEAVVERLLASPHFGERQARAWLDVARYADSNGVDENLAYAEAWRYRDWVVRAFNADLPYDRFLTEQLAGDLLPEPADREGLFDQWTATGFLVLGPKMLAEQDKEKLVMDVVDEQLDVVGQAFLGLTLGCARCHDHKFDPIPTRDYYALAGVFKSTSTLADLEHVSRWRERELATAEELAARDAHVQRLEAARASVAAVRERADAELDARWRRRLADYLLVGTAARRSARFLPAEGFARGNLRVDDAHWGAPQTVVVHTDVPGPQFVEYDVVHERPGRFRLELRYAAAEARPLRLLVGGAPVAEAVGGEVTGGWLPEHQRWSALAVLELPAGTSVLRLERDGPVPHLDELLLVPLAEDGSALWPPPDALDVSTTLAATDALDARETFAALDASTALDAPEAHDASNGTDGDGVLVAPLVRNWAALLAAAERHGDPLLNLWSPFADLPAGEFAARAPALVLELRARVAAGELVLSPLVLGLLDGPPPADLREWAARHQAAFAAVERAVAERQAQAEGAPPLSPSETELTRRLAAAGSLSSAEREEQYGAETRAELTRLGPELAELERTLPPPFARILSVRDGERPADVAVHVRGSHLNLAGEPVPRGTLRLFDAYVPPPAVPAEASGRLELARWMCHPEHPLTARVIVNRLWQGHFGAGLVATASHFGMRGAEPTHPALLDWLARELVRSGWSLKHMHRLIVLSSTYALESQGDGELAAVDPENRLLGRRSRRRLEAEAVRDALLAVGGTLDGGLGGSLLGVENAGYVTNDQSADQARYGSPRRSLYLPVIRNATYELFTVFDYADPSVPLATRPATVVASQALFFLNSPLVLETSRAFAALLLAGDARGDGERIDRAWLRAYGRPVSARERELALEFLDAHRPPREALELADAAPAAVPAGTEGLASGASSAGARREPAPEPDAELLAWQDLCQVLFSSNEFLHVD